MAAEPTKLAEQLAAQWFAERNWLIAHPPARLDRPARIRQPRLPDDREDALLSVPPAAYVEALTGAEVPAHGMIHCPLHEERTPSFRAYDDPERGWYCFGCDRGGDVYAFAGAWWGIGWRTNFLELRRRLAAELLRVWT